MGSANFTAGASAAFTDSVASWALLVWILSLLGLFAPILLLLLLVLVSVLLLLRVLQMLRHLQAPRA